MRVTGIDEFSVESRELGTRAFRRRPEGIGDTGLSGAFCFSHLYAPHHF